MTTQPDPTGPRFIHAHWCQDHDDDHEPGCQGPKIPYGPGEDDWLFIAQRAEEPLDIVVVGDRLGCLTVERAVGLVDALDAAITMAETPGYGLLGDGPRSAA